MRSNTPAFALLLLLVAFVAPLRAADAAPPRTGPLLSPIFGDHMVLQRGKPNTFWGWTKPGQNVHVTLAGASADAVAAPDGRWQAVLEVAAAGGPYSVAVDGGERVVLNDVLVGDVWLCGGQSNIGVPLQQTDGAEAAIRDANQPTLRLYTVANQVAYSPASVVKGEWRACTPQTAAGFSAVAYHFARRLQRDVHVPIGLIQDGVGGSPAESWMSAAALTHLGEFGPQLAELSRLREQGAPQHGSFLMHWLDEHDVGGRGEAWAKPDFDDHAWKNVPVPGGFAELGVPATPAVVWFRREITLPDPLPAGTARLVLGVVERMDTAYINGRWIGASSWVENPRNYVIPAGVLKPGRNAIAVRVFKTKPDGGFLSPAATLQVQVGDKFSVPLAGSWRAALSYDARPPAALPLDFDNYPTMPAVLYNGMIAPLAPLAIAGAIWYQGEANAWRPAAQYRKLLPALIRQWRDDFGQGEFPFYVVSLPAFQARKTTFGPDGWANLRGAQIAAVREVRKAAAVITVDTGDANNIHPRNKQPVGERLALAALAGHYRLPVVAEGPTLRCVERRPGSLVLHFDHAEGGLQVRGEKLGEFAVAGADGVWHWAEARIAGPDTVVVTSPDVPAPTVAQYAWQANPLATLFNAAGLPAVPFRTDE
jgi:sialate O-acetylesterase